MLYSDKDFWNYNDSIDYPVDEFEDECLELNSCILNSSGDLNEAFLWNFDSGLNFIVYYIKNNSVIKISVTKNALETICKSQKIYGKEVSYKFFVSNDVISDESYVMLHAINRIDPPRILHNNKIFISESVIGRYFRDIYGGNKNTFNKLKNTYSLFEYGNKTRYYLKCQIDSCMRYLALARQFWNK